MKLADVSDIVRGVTYAKQDVVAEGTPGAVPLLRATNIQDGALHLSDFVWLPERAVRPEQRLRRGDIVVATSSGSLDVVGKNALVGVDWPGTFGAFCATVRPTDPELLPAFLSLVLRSRAVRRRWSEAAAGTNINNLKVGDLAATPILVPPMAEQIRIATTLDEQILMFERIDILAQQVVTTAQALRRSLLTRMVSTAQPEEAQAARTLSIHLREARPVAQPPRQLTNSAPDGFITVSLDEITDPSRKAAYGVLQPGPHVPGGVPLVRVGDVNGGGVATARMKLVNPEIAAAYPRTTLRGGELLVTLVGTVGRAAVAPPSLEGANVARAVGVVPLSPLVNPDYVALCLQAEPYTSALVGRSHEVARKTLNLADLRAFPVPLTSRARQDVLAETVTAQLAQIDAAVADAERLRLRVQSVRGALLTRAVTGGVSVNDLQRGPSNVGFAGEGLPPATAERAVAVTVTASSDMTLEETA